MFLLLFCLVPCFGLLWFYIRWRKVKRIWLNKGVPHYPPHPIMGSLTFLQRQNPIIPLVGTYSQFFFFSKSNSSDMESFTQALWMRQIYKDFKSPYVGMWLFWRPALVVNNPDIAKRILVKDVEVFRNRFVSSGKSDPIGALNLFTVNDPIWTPLRRRLTSVFTAAKLRYHNHITQVKSNDFVQRIKEENAKNNILNLRKVCTDYTTDVVGESAFGISSEAAKTGDSIIKRISMEMMEFNLYRGLSWSSIFFFPELVDIFRFKFFPTHTIKTLRQIFRSIIHQRGGYDKKITEVKDLLDSLLKIKQEAAEENEMMCEDFLLAQAAVLLFGGFDTTGATMSRIIYNLAWHPQVQQKLYEEISTAKQKIGDKDLDISDLSGLTYLTAVIKETLRIYPTMGWLDRIASREYQIDENLSICAGTVVYVNAVGIQIDPEYFPDPLVFNPDRFLPGKEKDIKPYTFMPFGEGPRSCIGMRFAYQTLRQGISSIILSYEIRTLPNTPKPLQVSAESKGLLFMPLDENMVVQFKPRGKV